MKRIGRNTFWAIVALGLIFATGFVIRSAVSRAVCDTDKKLNVEISGIRFEVEDVSCDVIAKDEEVNVYATKTTSEGHRFFPAWGNRRTLLFKYDPGRWDNPLPFITRPSKSSIHITVPEVSSIEYQIHKWDDISVDYDIGRVDYPSTSK